MNRRVAIYARVSTSSGQSVGMQLHDLRQLVKHRGFELVGEYCDEGVSGSRESRPALDDLLRGARRRKFDAVLVWKLDRLGRSLVHLLRLLEELRGLGVELISFSEGLDFTTTTGKLLYQVISAFAEFERDCIRERVMAGMRNARARGKRIGRPPKVVDAFRISELRAQGASWREIAEKLRIRSHDRQTSRCRACQKSTSSLKAIRQAAPQVVPWRKLFAIRPHRLDHQSEAILAPRESL